MSKEKPSEKSLAVCPICNLETTAQYCPNCGTKQSQKAISLKSLLRESFIDVLAMGNSGLGTLLQLVLKPHSVIDFYYKGYKRYYQSPFRIIVYALSIAALRLLFDPTLFGTYTNVKGISTQVILFVILVPLLSLASYLAFIKYKVFFIKHLISIAYLAPCIFIMMVILEGFIWLLYERPGGYYFNIFILFIISWNSRVFVRRDTFKDVFLSTIWQLGILVAIILLVNLITQLAWGLAILMPSVFVD